MNLSRGKNHEMQWARALTLHPGSCVVFDKGVLHLAAQQIGNHIAKLIEDGLTLQIGFDAVSQITAQTLSNKNNLGVHSQFLTESIMHLCAMGNII